MPSQILPNGERLITELARKRLLPRVVVPNMPQKVRIPGKLLLTNFALVSLLACVCQKVLVAIRLSRKPLGAHWALEGSLTGVVIPHMLFAVVFPVVKDQVWSQIQKFQ